MHIIAAFSNEFKSEECVERLKTILKLLEEDKDEVLECKGGNRNSEKRDIVEAECKETERVEAERKKDAETVEAESTEAEKVEAECKKEAERVDAESTETERVEAECKKDAEMVEAESTEAERVEAECKKEAERVDAESTENERVEAEHKKDAEMVEAESTETERVVAEHKKAERVEAESTETERVEAEHKKDAETVEAESKTEELCKENKGKSKKLVGFPKSVECNTETVPEDNLDDTCSEQQVNFNPPSLEQIEKHVAETIEEIRSFGACTESDDRENRDSDSLVIDDQSDSTPPCSQMAHKYGKTR